LTTLETHVAKDEPTTEDANYVESMMKDVRSREEDLVEAWNKLRVLSVVPEEVTEASNAEQVLRDRVYQACASGYLLISKVRAVTEEDDNSSTTTTNTNTNTSRTTLEKMKPPKFSGKIRDFARFKSDYESIVTPSYPDEVHQVYVLKERCLQTDAYELVKNISSLSEIWNRLSERYGDSTAIVDAVNKDIQNANIARQNSDAGFIEFVGIIEKGVEDLTMIEKQNELASALVVRNIENKLPRSVMHKWLEETHEDEGDKRFFQILKFLKEERKRVEKLVRQRGERDSGQGSGSGRREAGGGGSGGGGARVAGGAVGGGANQPQRECLLHPHANHFTRKCAQFKAKSVNERGQLVMERQACKLCLSTSHIGQECPHIAHWDPCGVNGCNQHHSRLIHGANVAGLFHIEREDSHTLLLIQTINSEYGPMVTFWDNGSQITLVTSSYVRRHKLSGIVVEYDLITVNNQRIPQNTRYFEIPITDNKGKTHIIQATEIDDICQETEFVNVTKLAQMFDGLNPHDVVRTMKKVDILIGSDNLAIHPSKVKTVDNLVLYDSMFGTGKILAGRHEMIKTKWTSLQLRASE
jgi:hypothetical protein